MVSVIPVVIFTLTAIVLPVVVSELTEWTPRLALRIVQRAAGALPEPHSERYGEEWAAELESVPGKISKLIIALSIFIGMRRLRRSLPTQVGHAEAATLTTSTIHDVLVAVNGAHYIVQSKHRTGAITVADVIAAADAGSGLATGNAALVLVSDDSLVQVSPEDRVCGPNLRFLIVPEMVQGPGAEGDHDHQP